MKKIGMIAAVLVLFTACNKEETINPVKSGTKMTAIVGVGTKTSVDGLNVLWSEGDQMTIIDTEGEHPFTADVGGQKRTSISSADELVKSGTYYGFYPSSAFTGFSGTTFSGSCLRGKPDYCSTAAVCTWSLHRLCPYQRSHTSLSSGGL